MLQALLFDVCNQQEVASTQIKCSKKCFCRGRESLQPQSAAPCCSCTALFTLVHAHNYIGQGAGVRGSHQGGRYLQRALSDCVNQLLDNHVHTLQTRRFQLHHLLFHNGFKRQVRGEEPRSTAGEGKRRENRTKKKRIIKDNAEHWESSSVTEQD